MISTSSPIVIFGAGSIGERHIAILQELNFYNLGVFRQRRLELRNISEDSVKIFTTYPEILDFQPKAAIICTPTNMHANQAIFCLKHKIPVLVEKPLAHILEDVSLLKREIDQNNTYVQVAYMLRYHPLFVKIKGQIKENVFGRLISMQSYWGEYLPDWHPWEDYRDSYAARQDLGGGVSLTLSHDIDIMNWLAGSEVVDWKTIKNRASSLTIDVESGADISLKYKNGVTAHCHLNFHEKVPNRWYRLVFENASVQLNYLDNEMIIYQPNHKPEVISAHGFEKNDMFRAQTKDFLDKVEKRPSDSLTYLNESEQILKICLSSEPTL